MLLSRLGSLCAVANAWKQFEDGVPGTCDCCHLWVSTWGRLEIMPRPAPWGATVPPRRGPTSAERADVDWKCCLVNSHFKTVVDNVEPPFSRAPLSPSSLVVRRSRHPSSHYRISILAKHP